MSTEIKSTYINSKSSSEVLNEDILINEDSEYNIVGSTNNLLLQSKTVNDSIKKISKTQTEENVINEEVTENTEETEDIDNDIIEDSSNDDTDALISGRYYDENYNHPAMNISSSDRYILEHLVMGEAGGSDFLGCALVAQCIRDTMVYRGYSTVEEVRTSLKYSGSLKREPNQDVLDAVSYIFDDGGVAVNHKIFYFYAPDLVSSRFHESQKLIVEYGGHRYFSTWD